ncbi:ParB/RepB/Spo0J family partition protein [Leucobacter musarum]|uniref:ParB/RepB/Spo0J family partition protein n=1 Tax=Leucobacter musarum TaxID=1930747 RepID=UPI0006A769E7|nr:ParB N-terminal domain-containing protein [Leucobacter musarum]
MTETQTAPQGTLEYLDPNLLIIEDNVRSEVKLSDEFVESIRQHGVLTPISGFRGQDGAVLVRAGQRRTLGARKAEQATVPVFVVDAATTVTARIVDQIIENDQRQELTEAERIVAWKQLSFEGMSDTKIAAVTGAKRDRVKTGVRVAKAERGTEIVAQGVTLDQAADMLEFADDPAAVDHLTKVATESPFNFRHALERERQRRDQREACAPMVEAAENAGFEAVTTYADANDGYPLHELRTEAGKRPTVEDLRGKDGVLAFVQYAYEGPRTSYYVSDPEALGFTIDAPTAQQSQSGPMTDEQKSARKELIANNKDWDAAEIVRREWLTELVNRKILPKDAPLVIAEAIAHGHWQLSATMGRGSSLAKKMLGIEATNREGMAMYLVNHPNRAQNVTLAVILGGIEETTSRETWRHPRDEYARYLQALASWGYHLSDVEKIAAKQGGDQS